MMNVLSVGEGLAPPVVYKKSLRFARVVEAPTPTGFGGGFDVVIVGAIHESPVIYKNIIAFCSGRRGRRPLQY